MWRWLLTVVVVIIVAGAIYATARSAEPVDVVVVQHPRSDQAVAARERRDHLVVALSPAVQQRPRVEQHILAFVDVVSEVDLSADDPRVVSDDGPIGKRQWVRLHAVDGDSNHHIAHVIERHSVHLDQERDDVRLAVLRDAFDVDGVGRSQHVVGLRMKDVVNYFGRSATISLAG